MLKGITVCSLDNMGGPGTQLGLREKWSQKCEYCQVYQWLISLWELHSRLPHSTFFYTTADMLTLSPPRERARDAMFWFSVLKSQGRVSWVKDLSNTGERACIKALSGAPLEPCLEGLFPSRRQCCSGHANPQMSKPFLNMYGLLGEAIYRNMQRAIKYRSYSKTTCDLIKTMA